MFDFLIDKVEPYLILLPILIAIYRFKELNKSFLIILFYLIASSVINGAAIIMANKGINNMPLFHIFTIMEFVVLLYFYQVTMPGFLKPKIYLLLQFLFVVICILNIIFVQNLYTFNSYSSTLEAFLLMLLSIRFFYKLLDQPNFSEWKDNGILWINIGFLLYFSGAGILFLFSEIMAAEFKFYKIAWMINAILLIFRHILFAVGFLKYKAGYKTIYAK